MKFFSINRNVLFPIKIHQHLCNDIIHKRTKTYIITSSGTSFLYIIHPDTTGKKNSSCDVKITIEHSLNHIHSPQMPIEMLTRAKSNATNTVINPHEITKEFDVSNKMNEMCVVCVIW